MAQPSHAHAERRAPRKDRPTHVLKIHPRPFLKVRRQFKRYEIREWDRDYQVGDPVVLAEWDPEKEAYTGEVVYTVITCLTTPGAWGLPEHIGVFGFKRTDRQPGSCA